MSVQAPMPDLAEPANLLTLRETYKRDKAAVLQVLADSGSAVRGLKQTLKQLAILADGLLIQLWQPRMQPRRSHQRLQPPRQWNLPQLPRIRRSLTKRRRKHS